MSAVTRDKIINNLHPEVCRIKIPSSGACTTLYHCDDSGNNCVDRTADAGGAPIDPVNCVWELPYCEFSTWDEDGNPTPSSTTDDSSSSSGSGSGIITTTTNATNATTDDATEASTITGDAAAESGEEAREETPTDTGGEGRSLNWIWVVIGVLVVAGVIEIVIKTLRDR